VILKGAPPIPRGTILLGAGRDWPGHPLNDAYALPFYRLE